MMLGFTGTSEPMQPAQVAALKLYFIDRGDRIKAFHHGDCIHADAMAHELAEAWTPALIFIHPPTDPKARAFCADWSKNPSRITVLKPKPYLTRNHDIVDATDELLACPRSKLPFQRSGTWATVRYAQKKGKPVTIIRPDGQIVKGLPKLLELD